MKKLALFVFVFSFVFAGAADAATTTVFPGNLAGWFFLSEGGATATGGFESGPVDLLLLGEGSAYMTLSAAADSMTLQLVDYRGLRLDDIETLTYSTYVDSAPGPQAIALQLNIDADDTDASVAWQGRLVYEPYHDNTVLAATWQNWDTLADDAGWWGSGAPINGVCPQSNPCTWDEVLTAFPNAEIRDADYTGIVFKAGSGWSSFDGNVDALTINDDTYDFELTDADTDGDGVLDGTDKCPETLTDVETWDEGLGTNRWELGDDNLWYQNKSVKKGGLQSGVYDINDTFGCSGQQILAMFLQLGDNMNGHHKFGLSTGLLEQWILDISDGELDGMYLVDTVTVPADDADGVISGITPALGQDYKLKVSGTADACTSGCGYSIIFDAEYSTSDGSTWVDGVAAPYESEGPHLLDLNVDGGLVNWDDDATYNSDHTYWSDYVGTGSPISLQVYDLFYGNNAGNISVDIFADL